MAKLLGLAPGISSDEYESIVALDGTPIRVEPYNHEASRDSIRHYAFGIGDDNPLWSDPAYGAASPYGTLLAPPTFLYSVFDGAVGAGLPGVQPIYAGSEWTFRRRVRRNDEIVPEAAFGPVHRHSGRTASDLAIQTANVRYSVGGETVATMVGSTFRVPRRGAEGGLRYEARDEYVYTVEEQDKIRRDVAAEYRRGADRLDVTAVRTGDRVPAVVKGPIDRITMTSYYAGCLGSPGYKACELAWKYRDWAEHTPELLPNNYDPSYFAEVVLPSIGHQDTDVAQEIGMPNAYDNGPQRCGWFAHAVTNWMGDLAFLRRLAVRLRRPDIFGDTVWIDGEVGEVSVDGEFGRIGIVLNARNQLGDLVATGTAEVLSWADPARMDPVEPND
jgi:acyl dehydratase